MSDLYRDLQSRPDDEPVPDFGNRSSTIAMMLPALCASAFMGVASWRDFHDAWLSLFLSAPVAVVVAAIVLLEAPVRRWRARRDARAMVAGMCALEAAAAAHRLPLRQPASRSRSTRGS